MPVSRFFRWGLLLAVGTLVLTACEPYMSMTDQVPAQTRRAAALLPKAPHYVGMVDVETALQHLEELSGTRLVDSLRRTDNSYLQTFFEATNLDPRTDLSAVYGAVGGGQAFSAVLFGELTPGQLDRYLAEAPSDAGRTSTYRDVSLYHLTLNPGAAREADADTLTVAFVAEDMMAVGEDVARVTAMIDRHRAAQGSLQANEAYMALVKRVGRGSTAWLVGRNVVETALQDTSSFKAASPSTPGPSVSQAGIQGALAEWSDRVLGLSEMSSLKGRTEEQLGRLARRLREQALSIRLTDAALEGEAYLTMRDEASAASVVDVAEGAVAILRLSSDRLDERHRNLLDDVEIDREGAIVHVRFSLDRETLRETVQDKHRAATIRRTEPSIRPATSTIRRSGGISRFPSAL